MDEPVTFLASIPPLQSALTFAGDGGARLKIDIPDSEIAAAAKLLMLRGKVLIVSMVVAPDEPDVTAQRTVTRDPRARTEKLK